MKIIISPAKKIATDNFVKEGTSIPFLKETKYLVEELQTYSVDEIKSLMKLSDNLAQLNWQRFQDWNTNDVGQALLMFQGDVYQGLRAETFSKDDFDFAQENLRILSGFYGLLKPKDLIFPYRLEMGTKLKTSKGKNLYEFWGEKLYQSLKAELLEGEEIINLASQEYSKAIHLKKISNPIITPVFKDYKNGKLKVISFFAKKARGEMVNFIITNKIKKVQELKAFTNLGYQFSQVTEEGELLFSR
ncbi:MAG: peroxide stress protein YaaA [Flavobacteriales bacterium]|nr:peroxide stress protein YaaA [Flavobacteriales bacterium]